MTGNPVMCSNPAYGNPKRIMLEENPAYISHNTSSSFPPRRKYYFISSGSDKSQHTLHAGSNAAVTSVRQSQERRESTT